MTLVTRLRKVRRQRGSRTHGWGQMGQHRHSGSRGGTGMAGLHKHKWSFTVKYAPDHFGHNAFQPPNRVVAKKWANLADLPLLGMSGKVLDLAAMGYDKLLGQGEVHEAFTIKVPRASASAIEKIKAAGGSIEVEISASERKSEGQKTQKQMTVAKSDNASEKSKKQK